MSNFTTRKIVAFFTFVFFCQQGFSQGIGINNNGAKPNISAMLDVTAEHKGILIPRVALSTFDPNVVPTPANSLLVYNTNQEYTHGMGYYYNRRDEMNPEWVRLLTSRDGWSVNGNSGLDATHFVGTTDNVDLRLVRNNVEGLRVATGGALLGTGTFDGVPPVSGAGIRFMWVPRKFSIRAGYVEGTQWDLDNMGDGTLGVGKNVQASGEFSTALGNNTLADNFYATALGNGSQALGESSFASGFNSVAGGDFSVALGNGSQALGESSFASGFNSVAGGDFSVAMGFTAKAPGLYGVSLGSLNEANIESAVAIGQGNVASNLSAVALGHYTKSSGSASFAAGNGSNASADYAIAMGNNAKASAINTVSLGWNNTASNQSAVAIGVGNTANNLVAVAIGEGNTASGISSTAFGFHTKATNIYSTAMGGGTLASGVYSTVMGRNNRAMGDFSLAGGDSSTASGVAAIAIGGLAKANGDLSVALGEGVIANAHGSVAFGRFNINAAANPGFPNVADRVFQIGDGTSNAIRKDILYLTRGGNLTITGNLVANMILYPSDLRLKTDIAPLQSVLNNIDKIQPITYYFKDKNNYPAAHQIGFNAQEIEKEFPELVNKTDNGFLSVNYAQMTAVLLQAVKEQQQQIKELQQQIEKISKK
ncbi:MAG: tail fiber domain-containing protein [Chitinophagaceae bacterium]|nr:tail fiber domain-containing protein [Chitinophagaceae bacterium]